MFALRKTLLLLLALATATAATEKKLNLMDKLEEELETAVHETSKPNLRRNLMHMSMSYSYSYEMSMAYMAY